MFAFHNLHIFYSQVSLLIQICCVNLCRDLRTRRCVHFPHFNSDRLQVLFEDDSCDRTFCVAVCLATSQLVREEEEKNVYLFSFAPLTDRRNIRATCGLPHRRDIKWRTRVVPVFPRPWRTHSLDLQKSSHITQHEWTPEVYAAFSGEWRSREFSTGFSSLFKGWKCNSNSVLLAPKWVRHSCTRNNNNLGNNIQ